MGRDDGGSRATGRQLEREKNVRKGERWRAERVRRKRSWKLFTEVERKDGKERWRRWTVLHFKAAHPAEVWRLTT